MIEQPEKSLNPSQEPTNPLPHLSVSTLHTKPVLAKQILQKKLQNTKPKTAVQIQLYDKAPNSQPQHQPNTKAILEETVVSMTGI